MKSIVTFGMTGKRGLLLACALGALGVLAGPVGGGAVSAQKAAPLILILYVVSKVFMVSVVAWMTARHSPRFRHMLQRCLGR